MAPGVALADVQCFETETPKRDYYLQSRRGNRLFDLRLGRIALAFCGASDPDSQRRIDRILAEHGGAGLARAWLEVTGLDRAAAALDQFPAPPGPEGEVK